MLKSNIEANIEAKRKEREIIRDNIIWFDQKIAYLKDKQRKLLDQDTQLCYEISELEDMLNE